MWQSTHGDLPNSCVAAAEKGSQRKLGYIVLFRHCCVRLYGGRSTELSAQKWQWSACKLEESSRNRHTREHTRSRPTSGRKLTVRSLKEAEPCGGRGWRATVPQATEGRK